MISDGSQHAAQQTPSAGECSMQHSSQIACSVYCFFFYPDFSMLIFVTRAICSSHGSPNHTQGRPSFWRETDFCKRNAFEIKIGFFEKNYHETNGKSQRRKAKPRERLLTKGEKPMKDLFEGKSRGANNEKTYIKRALVWLFGSYRSSQDGSCGILKFREWEATPRKVLLRRAKSSMTSYIATAIHCCLLASRNLKSSEDTYPWWVSVVRVRASLQP